MPATCWSVNLHYSLDVQINIEEKKITGVAHLSADAGKKIDLFVRNLSKFKVDGKAVKADDNDRFSLTLEKGKETAISYEARLSDSESNHIDKDNVFLNGTWYPRPDVLVEYTLSVTLPGDFIATSEADVTRIQERGETKTFHFQFKHPLDTLHLAASTRYVVKKALYNNISIETYFFREDAHLADTYIAHTKKYLAMYEAMLTPYPYRRFAVVENIFPTGDSMPTYTLLGKRVINLPFIVKTSLGHEILHQWFGNSVYIDFAHGNWAEGITNYLADHHYASLEDKDIAYRKQILVDYHAYVNADNAMPVSRFYSRRNKTQSAIGYGKAAMLFHGLRKRFDDKAFFNALREFIRQNSFRKSSWHDIQRAFEKVTGETLYAEFAHWLTRKDIPRINVEDAQLVVEQGKLRLNFTLLQKDEPYPLRIPVSLYAGSGKRKRLVEVKEARETISLTLDEPPAKVVIDEDYDLMHQLTPGEIPPVLAGIMGMEKLTVVVSADQRAIYQPLIDTLGVEKITYMIPEDVTFAHVKDNSLLISGFDNSLTGMLFGKQAIPDDGVCLNVYKNPYNSANRIVLFHAQNRAEAQAVMQKIPHYGKYTELAFTGGKNTHKAIAESDNGIPVFTRAATLAVRPDKVPTLDDILPKLTDSRIIYVGEQHDQFAHHINQLQIIKKLHEAKYKLAVGMEAFQIPFQQAVDDYLAGTIDEHMFLEKTEYFNNWRYDYNLYKPIIDYLKQQNIPLIALNIEKDISRKIAREGIHNLTGEEKKQLPSALDLSDERYRRDLNNVFTLHAKHHELEDFNYFLQAQTIWDEVMAESAHQFLVNHTEHKLVILAGNGHVRRKYGIPKRLYRRNREPFIVVVQDEELEDGVADYVLLTTKLEGRKTPILGVAVEEKDRGLVIKSVSKNSPAMGAGLRKGDIIIRFAGKPVKSLVDLKLGLFYSEIGSTVTIQLKRVDKTLEKEIVF